MDIRASETGFTPSHLAAGQQPQRLRLDHIDARAAIGSRAAADSWSVISNQRQKLTFGVVDALESDRMGQPGENAGDMDAIVATRHWLEQAVIGLNLCPFAKAVHVKEQIRWVESPARDAQGLLGDLVRELQLLAAADPETVETTLLIHPHALNDFLDYNDFLDVADATIVELGLDGVLQVASFHPDYRFEGTAPDDVDNFTNRSPHPMLHLLREESIARAVGGFPDAATVYERNIETLRRLGVAGWHSLMAKAG